MAQISSSQATSIIESMLDLLYEKDHFLLQRKLNITERAVTHRMGIYLQQLLPDFHVDCEYNRMGKKTIHGIEYTDGDYFAKAICLSEGTVPDDDDEGSRVFPDIIVHRRGTAENYIIIEVKIDWKSGLANRDKKKLIAYKKDLHYDHACYIQLTEDRKGVRIEFI